VAHEIRNCLNPITGSIEMLRGEFEGEGEAQRLMDLITREGERLNQFIGELLAFARVEELRPTRVDLNSLVEEVTRLLECHPRRKPGQAIRCEADEPCQVRVDGEHLRRVFVNLGLNALEAMGETGSLTVRLRVAEAGEGAAAVSVVFEDTGAGIKEADLPHIFEPFFTTKQDGTGLGLALAQQVVARHGGRIEAESRFGEGTRMTVCLPAAASEMTLARAS
jgi:two-component system sensor histidine kinase HydH